MYLHNVEEIITCGICLETFNGVTRCPRMLNCGHSFCLECLEKLIVQSPCCPTCKKEFPFKEATSIPINFAIKSLMDIKAEVISSTISSAKAIEEAYIELKKHLSKKVESELGERKATFERLDKSLSILEEEKKLLIEEIKKKEQELKDHEEHIRALVSFKSDGRKFCQKLERLHGLVEISSIGGELSKAVKELEELLEEQKGEIPEDIPLIRLPSSKTQLENWCTTGSVYVQEDRFDGTKYGKVTVKDGRVLVNHFQPEKPQARLIQTVSINCPTAKFDTVFLRPAMNVLFAVGFLFFVMIGAHLTMSDKEVTIDYREQIKDWCTTGSVYVQEDRFDGTKYGKVTVKDGRILVHNFHPEKPQARLILLKELLSKFNGSTELPSTVFLRMTPVNGGNEVDVLIQTDGASPRAKNFLLLCSGLKGSTYKGMTMWVDSFSCFLKSGPAPVVEGISRNDTFVTLKEAGVYGMEEGDSGFAIFFRDEPSVSYFEIGSVVAGLQDLIRRTGRLLISDCGLVI